jgi:hypothetical protein
MIIACELAVIAIALITLTGLAGHHLHWVREQAREQAAARRDEILRKVGAR